MTDKNAKNENSKLRIMTFFPAVYYSGRVPCFKPCRSGNFSGSHQ